MVKALDLSAVDRPSLNLTQVTDSICFMSSNPPNKQVYSKATRMLRISWFAVN